MYLNITHTKIQNIKDTFIIEKEILYLNNDNGDFYRIFVTNL